MKNDVFYASYKHYMAKLDTNERSLVISEELSGASVTLSLTGLFADEKREISFCDFPHCSVSLNLERSYHELIAMFYSEDVNLPRPEIVISVDARGVTLIARKLGHYSFVGDGHIYFGGVDAYAINSKDTPDDALRCAIGPASSRYDNAIYDRQTDSALVIDGCRGLSLSYDFTEGRYSYRIETKSEGVAERIHFSVKKGLLSDKYNIDYAPMKLRGKYTSPPAGFMTWYSLKFDACESRVLENAKFQRDNLAVYGANSIWVDWEWCHRRYERERFDGVDNFHPDPQKYPNRLAYIAEEIKKLGLIPALWLGFTNDACFTDYEREHPEISLSHHDTWSGRYYYDMSHPEYLNGYLTKAVNQVMDWGFEAVKYDTLPNAITAHEKYHSNMLHPELTTYSAFREMVKKTREILGEDYYMVSCGSAEEVILWGSGYFDAARIGPDLFTWEKYVETLGRIRRYYALHSNAMYCDPDCVVLRDEYSTLAQAKSRIVPVSLLGLPLNLGDELTKLPSDRLELIKRALPTMNVHPTDFNSPVCDEKTQLIVLKIAMPYESYAVVALINLSDIERVRDVSISESLRLEEGKYLAYDYFADEFLGIYDDGMCLSVFPYDTRVIALRKLTGKPQLMSTSRHLTQGAADVSDINWCDGDCSLTVTANIIREEEYRMAIYVPAGFDVESCTVGYAVQKGRVLKIRATPTCTDKFNFVIKFKKL